MHRSLSHYNLTTEEKNKSSFLATQDILRYFAINSALLWVCTEGHLSQHSWQMAFGQHKASEYSKQIDSVS